MSAAGIILAAGESSRMGSPKALLVYRGETFLDRLIRLFAAVAGPVVVVLGHQPDVILAGLRRKEEARFVVNEDYCRGQLSSLACGLRALEPGAGGALVTLVDHPAVEPSTLDALLGHSEDLLVIPVYQGRRGHPVFFHHRLFAELLDPAIFSAKEVVRQHAAAARLIEVDDPGVVMDIDDPAAYRLLTEPVTP